MLISIQLGEMRDAEGSSWRNKSIQESVAKNRIVPPCHHEKLHLLARL